MTPDPRAVEALREAVHYALCATVGPTVHTAGDSSYRCSDYTLGLILAALPEGWTLIGPEQQAALADGLALARLREALPMGWSLRIGFNPLGPHWYCEVRQTWDPTTNPYISRDGLTIAAAADAAREALTS